MKTDRRTAPGMLAAAGLSACGMQNTRRGGPFVLVHGAWHDAQCGERVMALLQMRQRAIHMPTFAGMGERAAELSSATDLKAHIGDLATCIERRDLRDVVLVGHGFAGLMISGVADRLGPTRGSSTSTRWWWIVARASLRFSAQLGRVSRMRRERGAAALTPAAFGVLDPQDQAWVASGRTVPPVHTLDRPLMLRQPVGNGVPKAYSDGDCHSPGKPAGAAYQSLTTGHDAVTKPSGLAQQLLRHAA